MAAPRRARGAAPATAHRARARSRARLLADPDRRVDGRREKGGSAVARTIRGSNGTRYHLAVDANGLPLCALVSAGNHNERRYLLPLVDQLISEGVRPGEVWADRGYCAEPLREALRERRIAPQISRRRRAGEPIADGTATRTIQRGRTRTTRPSDPQGRHRWQIERSNAWLHAFRRIATRRDVKAENYQALLVLALIVILDRHF